MWPWCGALMRRSRPAIWPPLPAEDGWRTGKGAIAHVSRAILPILFPPHQPEVDVAVRHVGLRHDAAAAACVVAGVACGGRLQVAAAAAAKTGRTRASPIPCRCQAGST